MKKTNILRILCFVLTVLIAFCNVTEVDAYRLTEGAFANPSNVQFTVSNSAGTYLDMITACAETWETNCSEIGISYGSNGNIYVYGDLSVDTGVYAATIWARSNPERKSITLYKMFLDLNTVQKKETIVHEFGHTLGLDHCQLLKNRKSVMRETGFNNKAYPLSDDIAGISALY